MPYERLLVGMFIGCCVAIVVLGATLMKRRSRAISGLLMVMSIVGAMIETDHDILMVLMALVLVAGVLGLISAGKAPTAEFGNDESSARFTASNRLIWVLAFAPLIATMITLVIAEAFGISLLLTMLLLLNVGLGFCDLRLLESAGLDVSRLHAGTVFLVPWYISRRQSATRQQGYLATWVASFVLSCVVLAAWPYVASNLSNYRMRTSGIIQSAQVSSVLTYPPVGTHGAPVVAAARASATAKPATTDSSKPGRAPAAGP